MKPSYTCLGYIEKISIIYNTGVNLLASMTTISTHVPVSLCYFLRLVFPLAFSDI